MVYIDDKKFACSSCIKGHRSSSCAHTDRPLFEIMRKGRPISQCDRCRELRTTRKVHAKCMCSESPSTTSRAASSAFRRKEKGELQGKSKRRIPITPTLPNGVRDCSDDATVACTSKSIKSGAPATCACSDPTSCSCASISPCTGKRVARKRKQVDLSDSDSESDGNLVLNTETDYAGSCASPPILAAPRSLRPRAPKAAYPAVSMLEDETVEDTQVPAWISTPSAPSSTPVQPGCACGPNCTCAGCTKHNGSSQGSTSAGEAHAHGDCPEECNTCVDNMRSDSLSDLNFGESTNTEFSSLDVYFASSSFATSWNAVTSSFTALPSPLPSLVPAQLDEANLAAHNRSSCCGGACKCRASMCGCGEACDGGCRDAEGETDPDYAGSPMSQVMDLPVIPPTQLRVGGCCGGGS